MPGWKVNSRAACLSALLASSAGAATGAVPEICSHSSAAVVEAQIFSGTPNPTFQLHDGQLKALCLLLEGAATTPAPTCRVLGFVGWKLCGHGAACTMLRGDARLDSFLLGQLSVHHPSLPQSAFRHIVEETARLAHGGDADCAGPEPVYVDGGGACTSPIRGSNDPKAVKFDPQQDDQGCFVTEQANNNCYDYANDIVTNTFAQPGRGSGVCPPNTRPCVPNTCDDIKKAAVSDGLVWVGTTLPKTLPAEGHYVSLHIWPETNFHWLRMDANSMWSHKPGGSAVRNVDNNGKTISDPAQADVSPWSQHCGYLLATPSKANITFASSYVIDFQMVV